MILSPLLFYTSAICGLALAAVTVLLARRSKAGWTFSTGMLLFAVENACNGLSARLTTADEIVRWQEWGLLIVSVLPGTWLLFSLSYARGNAREFLTRWRWLLASAFLLPVTVSVAFRDHLIESVTNVAAAPHWVIRLGWAGVALNLSLLVTAVLILVNLERTFRASVGIMRWRIKYMIFGTGVLFTVRLYTSSQALLFREVDLSLQSVNACAILVAALLVLRTLLRAKRFDLDVYPSLSVLQGSITILLSGIYLLLVGVFAKIVSFLGGSVAFALSAFLVLISLVLLTVVLQSDRARLYLRRFVSRHFQRPIYDYRTVWQSFSVGTASRVEQADLSRSIVRLVAEMFQVLSVSLWLLDEAKETLTLAASTSLSETQGRDMGPQKAETSAVVRHFLGHPEPTDIEGSTSPWAAALRQWNPGEFSHGGHRVCIPLIGRGDMLGLITLGDRVGGGTYSVQDFDLLKCVGDHAAASLLNVQLSQKLMQAKELEAFQTMAAFFVHDLKNGASTLNLILQNLPEHFDDTAYRADALRGISKTVAHINNLIGKLSLLRYELKIQLVAGNLNEVVENALAGLGAGVGHMLITDLQPLPKVLLDGDQMHKVITNLALNATEAVAGHGQVNITTGQVEGGVVLTVTDNGCGMSPEFLNRSLFRPFQTTKKSGLGIGMFQSKMIVGAHGGRITVASEPGKGTTFQVYLPIPSRS